MSQHSAERVDQEHRGSAADQTGFPRFLAWATATGALSFILYVGCSARLLRPIADDYCSFRPPWYWFSTWSGDILARFNDVLWVGLPLRFLPWFAVSAVPFVATNVFLAAAVVAFLRYCLGDGAGTTRHWLLVASVDPSPGSPTGG